MNNVIDKTLSFLLSEFYVRVQNERKTQEVEKFTTITVFNITKIDALFVFCRKQLWIKGCKVMRELIT